MTTANQFQRATVKRYALPKAALKSGALGTITIVAWLLTGKIYGLITNNAPSLSYVDFLPFIIVSATIIYGGYRLAFGSLRSKRLKPKQHALQATLATVIGDALAVITAYCVARLAGLGGYRSNVEAAANDSAPSLALLITSIAFSLMPYVAIKVVVYFAALGRAEQEKDELFE